MRLDSGQAGLILNVIATPEYRQDLPPMFAQHYPLSDRPIVLTARAVFERELKHTHPQTLGELARARLKRAAKKDLGNDPQRWRAWLQSHQLG